MNNQFKPNLEHLKKRSKSILKSLRSGQNDSDQNWFKQYHPKSEINPEQIKLSDVQLAMARSYNVRSWNALKLHCASLEQSRTEIEGLNPILDSDLTTLHVRCGHDIQNTLNKAGFSGDFLPFIEPYCIGPLVHDEDRLTQLRALYVHKHLLTELPESNQSIEQLIETTQKNANQLIDAKYKRVVIWVEHDSYDQLMLIRVLSLLSFHNLDKISVIETNQYPGNTKFKGLGQLPPEALRLLWSSRKEVSIEQINQAKQLWKAFCSPTPNDLIKCYNSSSFGDFPNLKAALFRHLQELPSSQHGLSLTQAIAIEVLGSCNSFISFKELFSRYQEKEPLVFLGDLMFWALIKPLTVGEHALIEIESNDETHWPNLKLKLRDNQRRYFTNFDEYWVGGIENTSHHYWAWDHKNLDTVELVSSS